jgi:hypothetical protein
VWDIAHGFRTLKDILNASGIDTGTMQLGITGLSADGTTVVGYAGNRAIVAVIPEPSGLGLLAAVALLVPRRRR